MKIKIILINPWLTQITESRVDTTDIQSLYRVMSWLDHKVTDVMHCCAFPNGDNLLISMKAKPDWPLFSLGSHRGIAGCGVIMGNNNGEWDSPCFMLTELQDRVRFTK